MSRDKGSLAENRACEFLYSRDFEIVQKNYYSRYGEIDIVAKKDNIYHFVEVKSSTSYESAIENITPQKLSKLIVTINIYIQKLKINNPYQIDAIVVIDNEINFIENITF